MDKNILVLPGDGIGPEIMEAGLLVLDKIASTFNHQFTIDKGLIGGHAIDEENDPLPNETLLKAKNSDAVLLGAVGGPKWDNNPSHLRPERGLLAIRKGLDLYANLRPVKGFKQLLDASPLKPDVVGGSDLLIVRELTGGLYFGRPSERRDNDQTVVDTLSYTRKEMKRIIVKGFESAQLRNKKLTSVDKANVLESSKMWREIVEAEKVNFPDVTVEHVLVDACAMKLITAPTSFDVIVTENMFGDILSDEASVLTGSLGMLPSASLAENGVGLYEPAHGSAPDIANQNIANPMAMILSIAMMLRYSFAMNDEAHAIETAVEKVIDQGYHTGDLKVKHGTKLSTSDMAEMIVQAI
ncbi:3-isopropylmalate dehydrogenase [Streptohalobacillus salinus]|uniref:3-isopropylmalate dehydrogenase n=1 Tax=Streptohalobacillus salinus TaxID=621096 RepID=A0A2V3WET0_9BACI|nr:3-isopropylmalate dehydrogenase [Streptohalobacillus salinus]PXW92665.1 3-isopropylmalate dehydrogenase [Streptohalobacillus salinus]